MKRAVVCFKYGGVVAGARDVACSRDERDGTAAGHVGPKSAGISDFREPENAKRFREVPLETGGFAAGAEASASQKRTRVKRAGATGFEPAASWSGTKDSVH